MGAVFITIGMAARMTGVSIDTLRRCERRGVITPTRTASGQRIYSPQDLDRVRRHVAERRDKPGRPHGVSE